jgi:hypothetical protein
MIVLSRREIAAIMVAVLTLLTLTKMMVGTRNNPNLSKEFIRRNPFPKQKKTNTNRSTTS